LDFKKKKINEKTFSDRGSGLIMDFGFSIAFLIMVVLPIWFNAQESIKKGRNFLMCYLLSSLLVCGSWLAFGMWIWSIGWSYDLVESLEITWWIGLPIHFIIGGTTGIVQILFIVFFATLWSNYDEEGIIKVGLKIPNFIKRYLKNKKR